MGRETKNTFIKHQATRKKNFIGLEIKTFVTTMQITKAKKDKAEISKLVSVC